MRSPAAVHPCVRGERLPALRGKNLGCGSSLRTRGTDQGRHLRPRRIRFIPAYAGNGDVCLHLAAVKAVHPCVRGERGARACVEVPERGSSLRTRGTGTKGPRDPRARRFIPAYAGNGTSAKSPPSAQPVHPCVRGERHGRRDHARVASGSSLRTRGTDNIAGTAGAERRFIPAYAGNGPASFCSTSFSAVHPCVRGERSCTATTALRGCGSSLRTRGTERLRRPFRLPMRFIPAYAGNGPAGVP